MRFDYRPVISGQRKDALAAMLRSGLWVASWPYRIVVNHRNRQFDSGTRPIEQCEVPVISVGNITTGGTGKTPIVCYLARFLRDRGIRVAIVSRGYGRGEADENDEAMELHSRLPDVPHIQDPDRVAAARVAVEELESQIILMDDGFQHRRLHRDLNLVVVDATCPFGYGHLLPRGLLREPLGGFARADLILITRSDSVDAAKLAKIEEVVKSASENCPIIRSNHRPLSLLCYPSAMKPMDDLKGKKVAALCAIGNPDAFIRTIRDCDADVVESRFLPDHDPYSPETMASVREWIGGLYGKIDLVVCTHKDLVKIQADRISKIPVCAVLIELELVSDEQPLRALLDGLVQQCEQAES